MPKNSINFRNISSGYIIPVILLGAAAVGYFLAWPKYQSMKNDRLAIQLKQAQLAQSQNEKEDLQKLIDDYSKKKNYKTIADAVVPPAPEIPELLANLDYLATQSGISISGIKFTLLKESQATGSQSPDNQPDEILSQTSNLAAISIDLNLAGKYLNMKTFLSNLESNGRLIDTKDLNFEAVDKQSGNQKFGLKLQTYYQKK